MQNQNHTGEQELDETSGDAGDSGNTGSVLIYVYLFFWSSKKPLEQSDTTKLCLSSRDYSVKVTTGCVPVVYDGLLTLIKTVHSSIPLCFVFYNGVF